MGYTAGSWCVATVCTCSKENFPDSSLFGFLQGQKFACWNNLWGGCPPRWIKKPCSILYVKSIFTNISISRRNSPDLRSPKVASIKNQSNKKGRFSGQKMHFLSGHLKDKHFSVDPIARPVCICLRYAYVTPIFLGQTDPSQWDHRSPIS